jgi:hypothetical protein
VPLVYHADVQADFSVELAAGDPTLELPWSSPDPAVVYFDVKHAPALLARVPEVAAEPSLREFLAALNSPASPFETAKCDSWPSDQMDVEDEPFGAVMKFCSYVDVVPGQVARFSFDVIESFGRRFVKLLARAPEIPAVCDLVIRRCFYHEGRSPQGAIREGFYFTVYCCGYGDDEAHARRSWSIALNLLQNALLQLGREGAA